MVGWLAVVPAVNFGRVPENVGGNKFAQDNFI